MKQGKTKIPPGATAVNAVTGERKVMQSTAVQNIKAARKKHMCSWCGQHISVGESYSRYRFYDGSDASTVKMHPECLSASEDLVAIEKEAIEFSPGDHPRGCYCGHDADCAYCKLINAQRATI